MKDKEVQTTTSERRVKEPYYEPLLLKHEPLLDITGTFAVSGKGPAQLGIAEKLGIAEMQSPV
jgi:hypothetical protein